MAALTDGYKEAIVAGRPILINEPTPETNLATFPPKSVLGDYGLDNNPLLSAWIGSDFTGGHGVEEMNESLDVNRYRLSTFYLKSPGQATKWFKTENYLVGGAATEPRFLGDLFIEDAGWEAIISFVTTGVYKIDSSSLIATTIPGPPVSQGCVFKGSHTHDCYVVPLGEFGYVYVEGSSSPTATVVAPDADHPALQFCARWDYRLVGIDLTGQLWWTIDPTGDWTSFGNQGMLPSSAVPRGMVNFFDKSNVPTLFIITDTDVWQFDANGPQLATVDVFFPAHPYHGLASCRFGGDMYFSVGMGVHRYTGGVLAAVGLDRDHGLPMEYNGHIVGGGLVAGYNSMYAFVTGPTDLDDYTWIHGEPTPVSSIHEYAGGGWHMIWSSDTETIIPHSMCISRSPLTFGNAHNLVWGVYSDTDSHIYQYALPISFTNPRQRSRVEGGFAPDGWMETGIFDAGMKSYKKTGNAIDIFISRMDAAAEFYIKYKIDADCGDSDTAWTTLGHFDFDDMNDGVISFPFGTPDGDYGTTPGIRFERIQFRFELADNTNNAFVWEGFAFSFLKTIPASMTYTLDVMGLMSHAGYSPEDTRSFLHGLVDAGVFIPVVIRGETRRCFVSQVTGSIMPGKDERFQGRLSLVEVPLGFNE